MPLELYLNKPTLGELTFISGIYVKSLESSYKNLKRFLEDETAGSILKRGFNLPGKYKNMDEKEFISLLFDIDFNTDYYNIPYENISDTPTVDEINGFFENMYTLLSPETTLKRMNGDCKSLAIMCTTYLRERNVVSRLYVPYPAHICMEIRNIKEDIWVPFDPQKIVEKEKKSYTEPLKYDMYYEKAIELIIN
jgi:hypothetical protein